METQPKLLDQMRHVLRLKRMRLRTEATSLSGAKRFILVHGKRHPQDMGAPAIRAFLTHLAVHDQVAASTQNGALHALLFLYRHVLQQPCPELEGLERASAHAVSPPSSHGRKPLSCWPSSPASIVS